MENLYDSCSIQRKLTPSLQLSSNLYYTGLTNFNRVISKFTARTLSKKENVEASLMKEMGAKIAFEQRPVQTTGFSMDWKGKSNVCAGLYLQTGE